MKKIKRLRRLLAFVALLGLLIGIPLVLYFARNTDTVEAGWWDELWNYRKRISLGNSGSSQSNKRVSISTDTATMISDGKLQDDCDDIRFTDINGKQLEHRINENIGIAVTQNSHDGDNTNGTTFTFQHKVTSGSNQALVVIYHGMRNDATVLDVTGVRIENGGSDVQLTQAVESTHTNSRSFITSIWTIADPFNGLSADTNYDIVVTLNVASPNHVASAFTLTGVNQSNPIGEFASNNGSAISSLTVTTGTTDSDNSLLVGGAVYQGAIKLGHVNPPGVFSYNDYSDDNSTNQEAGGTGGYLRTTAQAAYSMTFTSQNGNTTNFNGAVVEIQPITSTTKCNTATTDVEVLVDAIPSGGTEIFMYYGNNHATSNRSQLADPTKTVAHDATTGYDLGTSNTNYSFNHTVSGSVSNPVLVAVVHGLNSQGTGSTPFRFTSVTYHGDLMQFRSRYTSYTTNRDLTTEVWILPNPDTGGSYALSATTNVTIDKFAGAAITLINVGQFSDTDWWTGGYGEAVASQTLTFTINGAARTLVGGAVELSVDANLLDFTTGTSVYTQDTGSSNNTHISAAGGYRAATPVDNTLVIGQASGTTTHINGAGISLIADQTYTEFTPTSGPTLQSEEKSPGPVLYWKLDETSDNQCTGGANDICDSTSNLNDGTYSATRASGSNCLLGGCYQFNGSTNLITLPTATDAFVDFSGSEAFSGSAWVYVTTMPTGSDKDAVIAKWDENSNHAAYRLYVENDDSDSTGNMEVQIYDESASQAIIATGITDAIAQNTWYHVAFSFNGGTSGTAGDLKIYVNGSYQAQNSLNGSFAGLENLASDFTVADYDTNDSTSGNTAFTGNIDEVKVFAYVRSADQIKTDYIKGSSASGSNIAIGIGGTPMPTPELWWRLDEGSGTTANNSGGSGSTYNGAITSGTWTSSGRFDKALTLTAASSLSDTITDPSYTHSISLWVYPTTSIASKTLVTAGKLVTDASSQPTYGTCTGTALSLSTWQHLAVVSNGSGSCKIYQNGVETSSNTTGVTFGTTFNVGGSSFIGSVDEVKFYTSALSADQVKIDYNARSSVNLASGTNERATLTDGDYSANLVGFWPLDENADNSCTGGANDACDRSGSGNDAAITAGTGGWTPGKIGSGYTFDNANTMINAGSGTTLDNLPASGMSVSAWIYPTSQGEGSAGVIAAKNSGATPSSGWLLKFAGTNALTFTVDGSTDLVRTTSNSVITLNTWNHVLVNWDGVITTAATADIYVNGYEVSYATTTNGANRVADGTSSFYIGNSSGQTSTFQGIIDQVRVFNNDLTPAQIVYEYNRGKPIAWWRMDECVGSTLNDAAEVYPQPTLRPNGTITIGGTGNYTATGNCVSGTSTHAWYAGATGKIGSSLGFDDTNDYITVADHSALDLTSGLSIAAWVKPAATEADNVIVSKGTSYEMGLNADADVYWYDGTNTNDDASTKVTASTWHHVVVTNNDTTVTYYVDGLQTGTDSSGIGADNATSLYIGYDGTNYFDGLIDDVRIFNYPLSANQVKQVFTGGSVRFE